MAVDLAIILQSGDYLRREGDLLVGRPGVPGIPGPEGPPGADGLFAAATGPEIAAGIRNDVAATPASLAAANPTRDARNYGARGDGVVDDTLAFQNAADAAALIGGTVTAPPGKYLLMGRVFIPSGANLLGLGVTWSQGAQPGTRFICGTPTAGITFDTVSGGVGGVSGNFWVDGNNITTTAPLEITQSTERTFIAILVRYSPSVGVTLRETQNCTFNGLDIMNCGTGLLITDGAGGNAFYRCELHSNENWHVRIIRAGAIGPYESFGPTNNMFNHCLFENGNQATFAYAGGVWCNAGLRNTFRDCAFQGSPNATNEPYLKITAEGSFDGVVDVVVDSCWFTGATTAPTTDIGISQTGPNTRVHLTGVNWFQNLDTMYEWNSGTIKQIGSWICDGVTRRWSGTVTNRPQSRLDRPVNIAPEIDDGFAMRVFEDQSKLPTGYRLQIDRDGTLKWAANTFASLAQIRLNGSVLQVDGAFNVSGNMRHLGAANLLGFYSAAAVAQQTVAAAATDPATTQALANSLRTILLNLGLVKP